MCYKTKQIFFCIEKVKDMLDYIHPGNNWRITYDIPENVTLTDWDKQYHKLFDKEDYFFIWEGNKLLYTVNVTGDSTLTAIHELFTKLAAKF
jgi:hypothetical protein